MLFKGAPSGSCAVRTQSRLEDNQCNAHSNFVRRRLGIKRPNGKQVVSKSHLVLAETVLQNSVSQQCKTYSVVAVTFTSFSPDSTTFRVFWNTVKTDFFCGRLVTATGTECNGTGFSMSVSCPFYGWGVQFRGRYNLINQKHVYKSIV